MPPLSAEKVASRDAEEVSTRHVIDLDLLAAVGAGDELVPHLVDAVTHHILANVLEAIEDLGSDPCLTASALRRVRGVPVVASLEGTFGTDEAIVDGDAAGRAHCNAIGEHHCCTTTRAVHTEVI